MFADRRELAGLRRAALLLQEAEETLQAGMILSPELLLRIRKLEPPWGTLASESIHDLRHAGASLLPTLRRIRALITGQVTFSLNSRTQSSQARAQGLVCLLLVPLFSFALSQLLPALKEHQVTWVLVSLGGLLIASCGSLWILALGESARWGNLRKSRRGWPVTALATGERLLALIRSGMAPETAWSRCYALLASTTPELALRWPSSVWVKSEELPRSSMLARPDGLATLDTLGRALTQGIQLSVFEGKPCLERLEAGLEAFKTEFQTRVEREIALLSTRALKPLFIFIAPSVLFLLGAAMFFSAGTELFG